MSESSSDTESSCGWTIISNEGSDIETLGTENGLECVKDLPECIAVQQDQHASFSAEGSDNRPESSHDATPKEEILDETLSASEVVGEVAGDEHVTLCSSSDHSDIVTLGDMREAELGPWEEQAELEEEKEATGGEDSYLGTSSSSQYTFSTAETVFPVEHPTAGDSSSSEDEAVDQVTPLVRRRRVRRSTTSSTAEPEEEQESGHSDREDVPDMHQEELQEPLVTPAPGHVSGTLNKCILLALVIAISMGFGHFYGTVQTQERQKIVEKIREGGLGDPRVLPPQCSRGQPTVIKSQKDELALQLKQTAMERTKTESQQKHLAVENQLLKSSLEREEESLSALQEELRSLRSQIRGLEERGAGADSILSENQRLKEHLEEEKQRVLSVLGQRETLMAEAHTLRKELDKERRVTEQLRAELDLLSSAAEGVGGDPETEELQARLAELEKKLSFEQQRSDLWERLYVETKEDKATGDKQAKVKKPKEGVIGKVKETFDAVKNSTKEFVHHHKEQIKKAKEAVKENLRKFSDSVKSTFRHFKDSATRIMDKTQRPHDRRFHERKDARTEKQQQDQQQQEEHKRSEGDSWQHRAHKPLHRHPRKSTEDSFQANRNTRKFGGKVQEEPDQDSQRSGPKGCSGVFDCAYQESMSLFNKAMDPIRADEFNQLLHSYLQQEVDHFHHWTELESFINKYFHNGVFIHDQMLFTDFVSGVEDYLEDMQEYHGHDDDTFEDLDEYIYKHFFGDTYSQRYGPSRPFEGPDPPRKEQHRSNQQQRKQQRSRPRPQRDRKWSRSGQNTDRHMTDVKIELGPMPFDPKY
ncbi:cell cycle progression protein 1 isoform X2 [Hypomesus transpacificus]|uniref:cell cycle progression protein 1 isoform X2 n=1 Tax=Hypomesus transpacificus TaxID=137520 RepID=UPI001F075A6D|nr:cell cycle progression protein 1 isoform X2 [Hypomesus transpacificus]